MTRVLEDCRAAFRGLFRHPRSTVAVVLSLALGVGATTATFRVVERIFLGAPPGISDPGAVVRIYLTAGEPPFPPVTAPVADYPTFVDLSRARNLSDVAIVSTTQVNIGRGSQAMQGTAQLVSASFFAALGARPSAGRFFSASEELERQPVVVLSFDFWSRVYGKQDAALGRTLQIGRRGYTIIGVAAPRFRGVGWGAVDFWLPVRAASEDFGQALDCRDCRWLETIARLPRGVSRSQAAQEATSVIRNARSGPRQTDSSMFVTLGPIQAARGPIAGPSANVGLGLFVVSLLVVGILCANLTGISLARAITRQREFAIRRALGATSSRILAQVLIEESLVVVLGSVGALVVGFWTGNVLTTLLVRAAPLGGDLRLVAFTFSAVSGTVLLSMVLPAVLVSRRDVLTIEGLSSARAHWQSRARKHLVTVQVAVTFVLLVAAGLFLISLRRVTSVRLGLDPERVIYVSMDLSENGFPKAANDVLYERVRENVSHLPGVLTTSLSIGSPFATSLAVVFSVPGADDSMFVSEMGGPYIHAVSPAYFAVLGSSILKGRSFTTNDRHGAERVAIVNESMARRFWPRGDVLGKCLRIGGDGSPCSEIVGVVEDIRRIQVTEQATMQYYVPLDQTDTTFFLPVTALLLRTEGDAASYVQAVRSVVQGSSPDIPYPRVATMSDLYAWQLQRWRVGAVALGLIGSLALLLSSVGLYGALSYFVVVRTHEIGVRMALGARRLAVVRLVFGQALGATMAGLILGVIGAQIGAKYWDVLVYDVSPTESGVLVQAGLVLLVIACIASYGPARRASSISPAVSLRQE